MRVEELQTGLDQLAGRAPSPPSGGIQHVRRTARRRRGKRVALAMSVVAVVLVVGALTLGRDGSSRVSPVETTPTTVTPPPIADPRAIFDQPRIGVGDSTGKVRGTIPTAAYKAAMGITAYGSPPPAPDNTPVPVLTDAGDIDGYWIPCAGFVERSVVERAKFDVDAYCVAEKAKTDAAVAQWFAGLTPEQRQQALQHGFAPPTTTSGGTP
jgi:hypothetical protein